MRLVLGNRHAIVRPTEGPDAGKAIPGPRGKQATFVEFPDETPLAEALTAVTHPLGVWAHHAAEGKAPAWVASDDEALATVIAHHYGGVEVRELPDDYDPRNPDAYRGSGGGGGGSTFLPALLPVLALWAIFASAMGWLKTNAGNDFQAAQMGGSASATAVAKWVALTANVTAPAAGDTTLTGEIVTGGGGLIRKAGTYAHTTGAASYTITTVFTANGSDSLPVTIGKRGIFDAASTGNMVFETLVSPTATLSASGDQLTLTDTISL